MPPDARRRLLAADKTGALVQAKKPVVAPQNRSSEKAGFQRLEEKDIAR
jgi:hypothetical protein